ncbi:hypothetical protein [Neolewinella agarilytica]|uniref:hypothetical protein n=1 Tax=Neolewinella agarilytica TaxID=478744 RepID=UPI002355EA71|nr:hypothetical protein [Neolewinella agarilytica]
MTKRKKIALAVFAILLLVLSLPELLHQNEGKSTSKGSVSGGTLENGWLLPWSGENFRYFSPLSYFALDRGYAHHKVHQTVVEAYAACETSCPGIQFRIMESARCGGGRLWPHRTHQIGMSVDFMVPKIKNGQQYRWLDRLGVWHYLLSFDEKGRWSENVAIDFETMGKHILALDDAARKNGLRIKKVILKIDLKDDFYATKSGQAVRARGIYLAKALPKLVDDLHDDHYHVDFNIPAD